MNSAVRHALLSALLFPSMPIAATGQGDVTSTQSWLADLDLSGRVDGFDLARLGRAFGASSGEAAYDGAADINRNNQVDGGDLAFMASVWTHSYTITSEVPATPLELAHRRYLLNDSGALHRQLSSIQTRLAFGEVQGDSLFFTLTSQQNYSASGTATFQPCVLSVQQSSFTLGAGPQIGDALHLDECGLGQNGEMLLVSQAPLSAVGDFLDVHFPPANIGLVFTNDSQFPVVSGHSNGEILSVIAGIDASGLLLSTGALWFSPQAGSVLVYVTDNGLPWKAVLDGVTLFFGNYTSNTVDVTFIQPGGLVSNAPAVQIPEQDLQELRSLASWLSLGAASVANPDVHSVFSSGLSNSNKFRLLVMLRVASIQLSVVGCGASVAATVASEGLLLPSAIASCGSVLLDLVRGTFPEDIPALEFASGVGTGFGCGFSQTLFDCLPVILEFLESLLQGTSSIYTEDQLQCIGEVASTGNIECCVIGCAFELTPGFDCYDVFELHSTGIVCTACDIQGIRIANWWCALWGHYGWLPWYVP